ncbi:MAG: M13 family metallopeptidase, partial [Bacteroidia bacterium]|nr:M13 family metallopeptidase [Bacteroidia bacterium]
MKTASLAGSIALLALCFIACSRPASTPNANTSDDFLWQWIDSTQKPGDDFFRFATGRWMKDHPIPASERRWGIANLVRDENYNKLRKICEDAAANQKAEKGSNTQKIGDFWVSGMDSVTIDKLGMQPLQAVMDKINAIADKTALINTISDFQVNAGSPLYSPALFQDEMNSAKYSLHFYQGGIGLPDRDYYFNKDSRTQNIRKEYILHVTRMFILMGDDPGIANVNASAVMKIETELAGASRKLEDLRDPYNNYHKMSLAQFTSSLTPSINWREQLDRMAIHNIDSVIIGQPEFYRQVEKCLNAESIKNWKAYLRWSVINHFAGQLSAAFDKEHFAFYGTVLSGVTVQRPRWKRILDQEENYLGDALGQLYVAAFVSPAMKKRYDDLVQNMMDSYRDRIEKLDWMTAQTKEKALVKLSKIDRKVCYPDKWKDYSTLEISRNSYLANVMNAQKWQFEFYVSKLYKPVDRTEWEMTPQT